MKTNEAPEKIWVHELSAKELDVPLKEYHIEYVRKDAFIKKTEEWLRKNQKGYILNDKDITDFIKYMKEE